MSEVKVYADEKPETTEVVLETRPSMAAEHLLLKSAAAFLKDQDFMPVVVALQIEREDDCTSLRMFIQ